MKYESYRSNLEAVLKDKQNLALIAVGELVKGDAVQKSPVAAIGGGNLKKSNNYKVDAQSVQIGNSAAYAEYLELGTRHMVAQPFLKPAFEENQNNIQTLIERYMKE